MNKFYLALATMFLIISGFVVQQPIEPSADRPSFATGEVLKYKVHYGLINAAEAEIEIAPEIHRVNDRPCYRANVFGKTVGSFDFFLRIRDTWRSFIDTSLVVPQKYHRNVEEGKYRKKENVTFDHKNHMALVETKQTLNLKIPDRVQDVVSGFYYLRTINFDRYKVGDVIRMKGYFYKKIYDMQVVYKGRETVDTKAGTFKAFKLVPKMPDTDLFAGESSVSVYLSDDRNKIPVMIKADLLVGAVKVDLYEYSGLKHRLNLAKGY
ncbi:DUF3108 domain-containing protein [Adhaeribacter pallidiroseus]|uniref:DUF3108 domain-containing protein n=1 Tax=Adhaeribacter pallidiroseus TaxID=2072847 RepID=A0A369QET7_9BACT|nr:DUF3108 domain-containing protein [Adhaeribacter pallidiroseus]RDC62085.1 hypothetical protein AHMF7616_00676 [Adhaeribacter pallidiroseus]